MASVTLRFEDVLGGEFDGGVRFTVEHDGQPVDGELTQALEQAQDVIRFVDATFETLRGWRDE